MCILYFIIILCIGCEMVHVCGCVFVYAYVYVYMHQYINVEPINTIHSSDFEIHLFTILLQFW